MCKDVYGGVKSINVFFSGDENVLVIKNCPFLVPVNEPVLVITFFCLDTGSIVYLMIGSIVERKSSGNTIVTEEQVRGVLSITFFPHSLAPGGCVPTSKGKRSHSHFNRLQMRLILYVQFSQNPMKKSLISPVIALVVDLPMSLRQLNVWKMFPVGAQMHVIRVMSLC